MLPPAFSSRLSSTLRLFVLLVAIGFGWSGRLQAQTASQVYAQAVEAYNRGDKEEAKKKAQLALEVDPQFRPANGLLTRMAAERAQAGAAAAGLSARALDRTVVPVEFSNTTLGSALEFIRQKAAEQSGGKLQINFAVNLPAEFQNKRITLKLDHVPVMEVLRYIGEQTGVRFEKQPYAIAVTPAAVVAPSPAPAAASPPQS